MNNITLYDVYVKLKTTFKNCDFLCTEPMSYIRTLTASNEKIIFAYKENLSMKNKQIPSIDLSSLKIRDNDNETKLDLTGNPLEDKFEMDTIDMESFNAKSSMQKSWTDQEESYSFIGLNLARDILITNMLEKQCGSGSLWTLCDGTDDEKIILLEIDVKKNWNSRGIVYFMGLKLYCDLKINDLLTMHRSYMPNCTEIKTEINTFFQIGTNSMLKLTWNAPFLSLYNKSETILYQTIKIGDIGSSAEEFWRQLMIMGEIRDEILHYKANENKNTIEYDCGSYIQLSIIKEQIKKILTDIVPFWSDEDNVSADIEAVVERARNRSYVDMTDQLWTILRLCSSYRDLTAAFQYIFTCSEKCNIVNIPINQNRLAVLIKEISQQRIAIPHLIGSEPLELLLEIGLEKLVKDYEFIFTESKICGAKQLNLNFSNITSTASNQPAINVRKTLQNAIGHSNATSGIRKTLIKRYEDNTTLTNETIRFSNSTFSAIDVERKLSHLAHIHLVLEHLLLMQINLNLENFHHSVIDQLKQPTIPFNQIKLKKHDKREFPISNDQIISKIKNCDPFAQRIALFSENNFRKIKNTFYYSINSIFPTNVFPFLEQEEKEKLTSKDNWYYGFHYLQIETCQSK